MFDKLIESEPDQPQLGGCEKRLAWCRRDDRRMAIADEGSPFAARRRHLEGPVRVRVERQHALRGRHPRPPHCVVLRNLILGQGRQVCDDVAAGTRD